MNEKTIVEQLLVSEDYARKIIPFIDYAYFESDVYCHITRKIVDFSEKYNKMPTVDILRIELDNDRVSEDQFKEITKFFNDFNAEPKEHDWMLDQTEKYFQDRAIYNSIMESIEILDGRSKEKDKGSIPEILSNALSVCFDSHIGHEFIDDAAARWESYHKKEKKVSLGLEMFDKITNGGLPRRSLTVISAGTGVGKTLIMCDFASKILLQGLNVLYITLEMSEEKIAERIDANLLDIDISELPTYPQKYFCDKIEKLKDKTQGRLIIKEYPTASVHAGHFRHLISELKIKKNFKPDIVFIDYINICASSRMKNNIVNSYSYVKAIAEEIRGLGVETDVPICTATQLNRAGSTSSDPDMTDTAESFGLPATADLMFSAITSENLEELGQISIKQLKNRYNDPARYRRFVLNVDKSRMRLSDCHDDQGGEDKPVMDQTNYGERQKEDDQMEFVTKKAGRKNFSNLLS